MSDAAMLEQFAGPLARPRAEVAAEATLGRAVFERGKDYRLNLGDVASFQRILDPEKHRAMAHDVRCADMNARMSSGAMSRRRPIRTVGNAPE